MFKPTSRLLLLMATALLNFFAHAQAGAPKLQPLAFLADQCWAGEIAPGKVDTHCYSWVYGGQFLMDKHIVRAEGEADYLGETLYYFDAATEAIEYLYWANSGSVEKGTVKPKDGALVIPAVVTVEGKEQTIRTVMKSSSEQCYSNKTEGLKDDVWVSWWELEYCLIDTDS